jgi:Fe-S cluster assembly iron-binding protein IscA
LALDEPTEQDDVRNEAGFRVIIDKALLAKSGTITVDYLSGPFRRGFNIKATSQEQSCSPQPGGCSCG